VCSKLKEKVGSKLYKYHSMIQVILSVIADCIHSGFLLNVDLKPLFLKNTLKILILLMSYPMFISVMWGKHASWWAILLTRSLENTYQQCKIILLLFREKKKENTPLFRSLIDRFALLKCHYLVHVKLYFRQFVHVPFDIKYSCK